MLNILPCFSFHRYFTYFKSNTVFITSNRNTRINAYASFVVASSSTVIILSPRDKPVIKLWYLSVFNLIQHSLIPPVIISARNNVQYNQRFNSVICVYANRFTEATNPFIVLGYNGSTIKSSVHTSKIPNNKSHNPRIFF